MIKALVADDSSLMRLIVSDILNEDKEIQVVGTVSNGKEAVEEAIRIKPDVLVLDMNMGEFDGTYTVRRLMKEFPMPIVILSALGNTNLEPILEALKLGAFDYVNKPDKNKTKVREVGSELVSKVKASVRQFNLKGAERVSEYKPNQNPHTFSGESNYDIIAIGASTGGPTAIENVIGKFPVNLPIPVVVVQHMPKNFINSFADRLDKLVPINVKVAEQNEVVYPGNIYIIPGGKNMVVRYANNKRNVKFDETEERFKEFNNPSIDGFMVSVAETYRERSIGVILTGMGKDGGIGLEKIKKAGGLTLAQDERSSVVFGMPKVVIDKGCVDFVLPVKEIGGFIVNSIDN